MTITRDFLETPQITTSNLDATLEHLARQTDYLREIATYLRRMNADVLATAVVLGVSQISNAITDTRSHEVKFEVGGKPVDIHKLFIFNSYTNAVRISLLSMANSNDGFNLANNSNIYLPITTNSIFVTIPILAGSSCIVNGPADSANGGLFIYGFTTSDWRL